MLFNSFSFLILVFVTFGVYYYKPLRKYQVAILIASSFTFYAFNNPWLLILLIGSIVINITTSWLIGESSNISSRKKYAVLGVSLNLIILAFFKYSGLLGHLLLPPNSSFFQFLHTIPLPIGISFFTFQGISLVVDTYRADRVEEYKNLLPKNIQEYGMNASLFISFFPQLVAGPIVKAHDFLPQIKEKRLTDIDWESTIKFLILGYFLKSVIADNLNDYTTGIAYPQFELKSSITLIILLLGYSMQIFADFAGYSLIAIGVATLFGYHLKQNFNFPYISTSFSEFWRRWHISLSTFLKEYLYISMGGNKKGKLRTYFNLLITMALGGLWHGAAWSYAVWGLFHGVLLAMERLLSDVVTIRPSLLLRSVKIFFVFSCVSFAWLLFILPEFGQAIKYIQAVLTNGHLMPEYNTITYVLIYSAPIFVYHMLHLIGEKIPHLNFQRYVPILYGLLLFLVLTNGGTSQAFIYFQF